MKKHSENEEVFQFLQPRGTVLDLGCGTGRHTSYIASRELKVVGVDISAFFADSHCYIYDFETLEYMLRHAGFTFVTRCEIRKSLNPELCDLEQHDIGSVHDKYFTLVVEAKKEVNQAAKAEMS